MGEVRDSRGARKLVSQVKLVFSLDYHVILSSVIGKLNVYI
jgi:hypothetical protein